MEVILIHAREYTMTTEKPKPKNNLHVNQNEENAKLKIHT